MIVNRSTEKNETHPHKIEQYYKSNEKHPPATPDKIGKKPEFFKLKQEGNIFTIEKNEALFPNDNNDNEELNINNQSNQSINFKKKRYSVNMKIPMENTTLKERLSAKHKDRKVRSK